MLVGINLASDRSDDVTGATPGRPGVNNAGEVVSISRTLDAFGRGDDATSLGTAPRGAVWEAAAGTWGTLAGQAYLAEPIAGRNLASLRPDWEEAAGETTLQVQVPVVSDGAGLVFRYRDVSNYWAFVAVPAYGTWAAIKVVDGQEQAVVNTGLSATVDGTTIGVRLEGDVIDLILGSRVAISLTDPELVDATGLGLTARNSDARFDDLRAVQGAPGSPAVSQAEPARTTAAVPEPG